MIIVSVQKIKTLFREVYLTLLDTLLLLMMICTVINVGEDRALDVKNLLVGIISCDAKDDSLTDIKDKLTTMLGIYADYDFGVYKVLTNLKYKGKHGIELSINRLILGVLHQLPNKEYSFFIALLDDACSFLCVYGILNYKIIVRLCVGYFILNALVI